MMDGEPCPTCDGDGFWMHDGVRITCDGCGGNGLQRMDSAADVPTLTEAELRATMELCRREMLDGRRYSAAPHAGIDWPSSLSAVCRQALAQLAELEALRGLSAEDMDSLLERWDQTESHIQRGIVAAFAQRCAEAAAEVGRLRGALDGLLDGLEANGDPERCGLSQEQWTQRVHKARALLEKE